MQLRFVFIPDFESTTAFSHRRIFTSLLERLRVTKKIDFLSC